jgi:hypothetical protein
MTLTEARQYFDTFKTNHPDSLVKIGNDVNVSDEILEAIMIFAEQGWLGSNISEKQAFEHTLKFFIEHKGQI